MSDVRTPKHNFYRVFHSGEVLPALRSPPGYEDDHPQDFEPYEAPVAAPAASAPPVAPAPLAAPESNDVPPAPNAKSDPKDK